jgi:hypothetical protein
VDSLISYPSQVSSAVVDVALPPIIVEIVDSENKADTTDSSTLILAGTTSGQLDSTGVRQTVVNGRAVFSTLRFSQVGERPILTFSVFTSPSPAVQGKTLKTGSMTVSSWPIPDFEIAFLPALIAGVNDIGGKTSLTFGNFTDVRIRAVVVVQDSAHQQAFPQVLNDVTLGVDSDEVTLSGSKVFTIRSTGPTSRVTSCPGCADFDITFSGYKSGVPRGSSVFLRFTVLDTKTAVLLGKSLVFGPVIVSSDQSTTCSISEAAPGVVVEFATPLSTFIVPSALAAVQSGIAQLMGVETARVSLQATDAKAVTRVNHSNPQAAISGTKTTVSFLNTGVETSANKKPAAELANEFVSLRPQCDAPALKLLAVYRTQDDQSCRPTDFTRALTQSQECARSQEECSCYVANLPLDPTTLTKLNWATQAASCTEETSLQTQLLLTCRNLRTCSNVDIQNVCDSVLVTGPTDLTWLWASIGSVGGLLLTIVVVKVSGVCDRRAKKVTLNAEGDDGF